MRTLCPCIVSLVFCNIEIFKLNEIPNIFFTLLCKVIQRKLITYGTVKFGVGSSTEIRDIIWIPS